MVQIYRDEDAAFLNFSKYLKLSRCLCAYVNFMIDNYRWQGFE